jgi:hypothetical protein
VGRKPIGMRALNPAERQRRYRRKQGIVPQATSRTAGALAKDAAALGVADEVWCRELSNAGVALQVLSHLVQSDPRYRRFQTKIERAHKLLVSIADQALY